MTRIHRLFAAASAACIVLLGAGEARAFRMIQNPSAIRTSSGLRVRCDDPLGFVHWTKSSTTWRLNPANQGGEAGVTTALQGAMAAWTGVSPASHTLSYGGTTNAGFVTDGTNTLLWASGNGCTGGCLAMTALVLGPGQVINEADVSFNNAYNWQVSGGDYDVQAIAVHELGHCMGIHHTEITRPKNRPSMYASYFGTAGRTLETDDRDALNCAQSRYAPAVMIAGTGTEASSPPAAQPEPTLLARAAVRIASRSYAGHATVRFALSQPGPVRLEVFDVAGRRIATLLDGIRGAGEHEVAWDGATSSGRASRGLYFARIETPEGRSGATLFIGR